MKHLGFILTFMLSALVVLTGCGPREVETASGPQDSPYWSASDRMIDLNGQLIRLRETGPADAPTVILLHGFTDSLHTWDAVVGMLGQEFRILRPDLPGHGLSGPAPNGDYSKTALVETVRALIDETDAAAPILVGNSLGGLAAWRVAAAEPESVSGLVLLAPGGVPHNGVGDTPVDVPMMLSFYLKNAPEAGVRTALKAMHADPEKVTEDQVSTYRDMMQGQGEAFVARAEQFTLPDPSADLAALTMPTIVLWGAQDAVLPVAHADVFATNIKDATVITLDNVGHMPQSEAPERVANAIRDLAAQLETTL